MDWLEGNMGAEEARIFQDEMVEDAELSRECDVLSVLASRLRDLEMDIEPSPEFHHNLMNRIHLESSQPEEGAIVFGTDEPIDVSNSATKKPEKGKSRNSVGWKTLLQNFVKRRAMIPAAAVFCCVLILVVYAVGNQGSMSAPRFIANESGANRNNASFTGDAVNKNSAGSAGGSAAGSSGMGGSTAGSSAAPTPPMLMSPAPPAYEEKSFDQADDMDYILQEDGSSRYGESEPWLEKEVSVQVPAPDLAFSNTAGMESAVASGSGSGNGSRSGMSGLATAERKVIRTGDIFMEVGSFDETVAAIKFTIMRLGGYVTFETSYIIDGYERKAGAITVKVPYDQFDEMVSQTEALGKVMDSRVWAEDVTSQYVDLQARIDVYETKRVRLMALLKESGDLTAVLQIENELAAANAELESMKGQMRYLLSRTDYSTLEVSLTEKAAESTGIRTSGFAGFTDRVGEAFLLGVNGALSAMGDSVLWLVRNLIGLVVTAVVLWLCWVLVIKRWLKKRNARRAEGRHGGTTH
jgi:hypothetical protein